MGEVTQALREIWRGAVARLLLAEILHLAEREGILTKKPGYNLLPSIMMIRLRKDLIFRSL